MNRYRLLFAALFCMSSYAHAAQPNVLLIISDDMGFAELETSNTLSLNQLASQSANFTHAYAYPVCSPTRAALQTGRWAERSKVYTAYAWNSTGGMANNEVTLAEQFKRVGYHTALVGKWHLGRQQSMSPLAQGYDHHYGSRGGAIDQFTHRAFEAPNAAPGPLDWWRDNTLLDEPGYSTTLEANEAKHLIETVPEPWFITVAWHATHAPRQGPDGKIDYFSQLRAMDQATGQILRHLDKVGLGNDTIIWFVNDNGGYPNVRNGGLRGEKGTLWEGGVRVPQLVRWPGHIAPGKREGNVHIIDVLPTLMALVSSTPLKKPDGISLAPTLLNNAPVPQRPLFWSAKVNDPVTAVNDGRFKLVLVGSTPYLFDLWNDRRERNNLAASESSLLHSLGDQIAAWRTRVGR